MNRKDAVSLIKEITEEKCTNLTGHDIILNRPDAEEPDNYELHIKTRVDEASLKCLEVIVEHNGYVLNNQRKKGLIVVSGKAAPFEGSGIM